MVAHKRNISRAAFVGICTPPSTNLTDSGSPSSRRDSQTKRKNIYPVIKEDSTSESTTPDSTYQVQLNKNFCSLLMIIL